MTDLFTPFDLAGLSLSNRVVMAPMTRSRAPDDVASERVALYYAQRATAGLIVSEGAPISREGQGYLFNPGIFTREQIAGWKLTAASVHAVGGRIFAQIWHVGRVSHPSIQDNGQAPVSATARIASGATAYGYDADGTPSPVETTKPRALTTEEVGRVVQDFADGAANAIEAGFDGVEIHGANGYLIEQFLNPLVNDRTDRYAAVALEDRLRFVLEVVDAVSERIGSNRVGIRLSPFGQLFDMPLYDDIEATYAALASALSERRVAYVHIMDQSGFENIRGVTADPAADRMRILLLNMRQALGSVALILTGGLNLETASALIEEGVIDLAGFGKMFISNPDLVARLRYGYPLAPADPATFYGGDAHGYIDYPPYTPG